MIAWLALAVLPQALLAAPRIAQCPHGQNPKTKPDGSVIHCLPGQSTICGSSHICFYNGFDYQCCPTAMEKEEPPSRLVSATAALECPAPSLTVLDSDGVPLHCHNKKKKCPQATMFCSDHAEISICCEGPVMKQEEVEQIVEGPNPPDEHERLECPHPLLTVLGDNGSSIPCDTDSNCPAKTMFCSDYGICCEDGEETASDDEPRQELETRLDSDAKMEVPPSSNMAYNNGNMLAFRPTTVDPPTRRPLNSFVTRQPSVALKKPTDNTNKQQQQHRPMPMVESTALQDANHPAEVQQTPGFKVSLKAADIEMWTPDYSDYQETTQLPMGVSHEQQLSPMIDDHEVVRTTSPTPSSSPITKENNDVKTKPHKSIDSQTEVRQAKLRQYMEGDALMSSKQPVPIPTPIPMIVGSAGDMQSVLEKQKSEFKAEVKKMPVTDGTARSEPHRVAEGTARNPISPSVTEGTAGVPPPLPLLNKESKEVSSGEHKAKAEGTATMEVEVPITYTPHHAGGYAVERKLQSAGRTIVHAADDGQRRAAAQAFLLQQIRDGWPYDERFYRPPELASYPSFSGDLSSNKE